jgi:hypothetical protein
MSIERERDWAVEAAEDAMLFMETPVIDGGTGKVISDQTEIMWMLAGRIRQHFYTEMHDRLRFAGDVLGVERFDKPHLQYAAKDVAAFLDSPDEWNRRQGEEK